MINVRFTGTVPNLRTAVQSVTLTDPLDAALLARMKGILQDYFVALTVQPTDIFSINLSGTISLGGNLLVHVQVAKLGDFVG